MGCIPKPVSCCDNRYIYRILYIVPTQTESIASAPNCGSVRLQISEKFMTRTPSRNQRCLLQS